MATTSAAGTLPSTIQELFPVSHDLTDATLLQLWRTLTPRRTTADEDRNSLIIITMIIIIIIITIMTIIIAIDENIKHTKHVNAYAADARTPYPCRRGYPAL